VTSRGLLNVVSALDNRMLVVLISAQTHVVSYIIARGYIGECVSVASDRVLIFGGE